MFLTLCFQWFCLSEGVFFIDEAATCGFPSAAAHYHFLHSRLAGYLLLRHKSQRDTTPTPPSNAAQSFPEQDGPKKRVKMNYCN